MNNVVFFRTVSTNWVREVQHLGRRELLHKYSYHGMEVIGYRMARGDTFALYLAADREDGIGEFTSDKYGGAQFKLDHPARRNKAEDICRDEAAAHWQRHNAENPDDVWSRIEAAAQSAASTPQPAPPKRFRFLDFLTYLK